MIIWSMIHTSMYKYGNICIVFVVFHIFEYTVTVYMFDTFIFSLYRAQYHLHLCSTDTTEKYGLKLTYMRLSFFQQKFFFAEFFSFSYSESPISACKLCFVVSILSNFHTAFTYIGHMQYK